MPNQIIDGKKIAEQTLAECRGEVTELKALGTKPGLAVVLVGADPASQAYVGSKVRTCADLGIHSEKIELPAETSQEDLLEVVVRLNADPAIHGILVQSPLPKHMDEEAVVKTIDPAKDVDGFHPVNVAKLAMEDESGFAPCTPLGCLRLLEVSGIPTEGARVVVVGRSMIVGKTLALLLMANRPIGGNATVTVAHSRTRDLAEVCRGADVIVAAVGVPELIGAAHVGEGTVVLDVGVNRVEDRSRKRGYRLVGDVDFDAVAETAGPITPVPGGVGPMTIAMLMKNTLKACRQQLEHCS